MNRNLNHLEPYPFEKLIKLKEGISPSHSQPINMSIGEPKHPAPEFILKAISQHRSGFSIYPTIAGSLKLREAIVTWLNQRFQLNPDLLDPEKNVLPVNGTREALFAIAQTVIDPRPEALVLMPNPFYQIYEGATILAGAKPWYINTDPSTLIPDFDSVPEHIWQQCQLLYICSPGNPTGAVMPVEQMIKLLTLADRHDFVIASDECYSEIYIDENNPPPGLLSAAAKMKRKELERCLIFHSLSKRSNLPGMRSGFVAGDAKLIDKFRLYRTYHGCAMPPPIQAASTIAWQDENHVQQNRHLYRQKFAMSKEILSPITEVNIPNGAFYLWLRTPIDEISFAQQLYQKHNLTVMPGSFLSRSVNGINPGINYVRIALVSTLEECMEAMQRIKDLFERIQEKI